MWLVAGVLIDLQTVALGEVILRIQGEGGGDKEAVNVFLLPVNSGEDERDIKGRFLP
jgi:hypothetical protein